MKYIRHNHTNRDRSVGKAGYGLVIVLVLALAVAACGTTDMTMDTSGSGGEAMGTRRVPSANGLFQVSIQSETDPIPLNGLHSWTINVETSSGSPVTTAEITIGGGMPAHGHGLPTQPQVTENLGDGKYRVEGMKFHMQGEWVVTFDISAGGQQDSVTLEFEL